MKKSKLMFFFLMIAFPLCVSAVFMITPGLSTTVLQSRVVADAIAPLTNRQEACASANKLWFTTTPPQCISNKGHYFFSGGQNKPVMIPNPTPKPPELP